MKRMLIGFVLGVVACLSVGAAIYHPVKGVVVEANTVGAIHTIMEGAIHTIRKNQEAIFNLINTRCGEH